VKRLVAPLVLVVALASTATALAADPRAEKERLTAADNALAKRAVFVREWLPPGWTATKPTADSDVDYNCPGYNPDFSALTITGKAKSAFKHLSGAEVESEVAVFKSRAQAVADFRLGMKPGLMRCVRSFLLRELAKSGNAGKLDLTVSARMTSPPRIGEQSGGFRVVLSMKPANSPAATAVKFYMDVLVVQKGRSMAFAFFSSLAKPVAGQLPLARAMAARMA
jgi:hypothetical protein